MKDIEYPELAGKSTSSPESVGFFGFQSLIRDYPFLANGTLRGNFIVSDDGCLSVAGTSRAISNAEDLKLLIHLRQVSAGLIVGRKTAIAESYRPPRSRPEYEGARKELGLLSRPLLVVVTSSTEFANSFCPDHRDESSPLFFALLGGNQEALRKPNSSRIILPLPPGGEGLRQLMVTLFERYPGPWLTEGGLTLLKSFAHLGLLDELCLTVSHKNIGDDCDHRVEIMSELNILVRTIGDIDTQAARYLRYVATEK